MSVKPLTMPASPKESVIVATTGRRRARPTSNSAQSNVSHVKKVANNQILVGRDKRALVEDPILTTTETRASAKAKPLQLLLKVNSTYRSVAGSRRQSIGTERVRIPLVCDHLISSAETMRLSHPRPTARPAAANRKQTSNGNGNGNVNSGGSIAGGGGGGSSYPTVLRTQWMVLPEFLSEELWERHQYSLADVRKTLDAFPARVLWQLVISYNRSATNASSRVCADTDLHMTFGGKSTAIQKLIVMIKAVHPDWNNRPSVTWSMHKTDDPNGDHQVYHVSERHVPGLPVHRIARTTFDHLLANLVYWPAVPQQQRSTSSFSDHQSYYIMTSGGGGGGSTDAGGERSNKVQISVTTKVAQSIFSWREIHIVALESNKSGDLLLMGRVVPWSVYVASHGLPESLRNCPNFILAPDGYYALLDETFYFYSPSDNPIVQQTEEEKTEFKVPAPKQPKPPLKKPKPA